MDGFYVSGGVVKGALVALGAAVVAAVAVQLPELRRYLKMERM